MIPCVFKHFTGIDCPGCGFQRSFLALLQGDFADSIELYPALIPFILSCLFLVARLIRPKYFSVKWVLGSYFTTASIIIISYSIKMI